MRTFETLEMSTRFNPGLDQRINFEEEAYQKSSALDLELDNTEENNNLLIKSAKTSMVTHKGELCTNTIAMLITL